MQQTSVLGPGDRDGPRTRDDRVDTAVLGPDDAPHLQEDSPAAGTGVGRYVVLEEIGRGGMGRVLRAYDPKLQREVALKEVRRDVLGREGATRLVAEARAMAKLSHPNVVAVYDVEGLGDDRLVLVMEYVHGTTLQAWLQEPKRPWREILRRFVAAGRGLAAAHGAGLLHRDFKPANVLLGADDDEIVKVTDFGLAKAPGVPAAPEPDGSMVTGETLASMVGLQDLTQAGVILGTPRYMAPEQHRGDVLSAAIDQYALCVALWEALCGAPPFIGTGLAAQKSAGPPPWPNPAIPRKVAAAIRRGLAVEPTDRWPTMDALLAALSLDEGKARHRGPWVLAGLGVAGLVAVNIQSWLHHRASRCAGAAEQLAGVWDDGRRAELEAGMAAVPVVFAGSVAERTTARLDGYADQWVAQHTEACEATRIRGEQSADVMNLRMACLDRAKLELWAAIEVLAAPNAQVAQRAHLVLAELPPLSTCGDTEALTAQVGPPPSDEAESVDQVRAYLAQAKAQIRAGQTDGAQAHLKQAEAALEGLGYGPVHTEVSLAQGEVVAELGRYDDAETALRQGLASASQWHQWDEMQTAAADLLAVVGVAQRRFEDGLVYRELAVGLAEGRPEREAEARQRVAAVLLGQGQLADAEAEARQALTLGARALGPQDPALIGLHEGLAAALAGLGRAEDAKAELRRAANAAREAFGAQHPEVGRLETALAELVQTAAAPTAEPG